MLIRKIERIFPCINLDPHWWEKLFRNTWAFKGRRKGKKTSPASDTFTKKRQGGRMQWEHTGNFQRHCVETKNEEKTTSMLYDYPRTGLARWTSLPQTLLEASERLSNKTLLNWITGSHSSDVNGHTFMIGWKSRYMGFKLGLHLLFSWFLSFSV